MSTRNYRWRALSVAAMAPPICFSILFMVFNFGCQPSREKEEIAIAASPAAPIEDSVVELTSIKAKVDEENVVRIEVAYKFTKGGPRKVYQCEFFFPDSTVHGIKDMAGWELKQEGVIKSGLVGQGEPGDTIEAIMREADSPSLGYHEISNRVLGNVEK